MTRALRLLGVFAFLLGLAVPAIVAAHEIRPAFLEISPDHGAVSIRWTQPVQGDVALALHPRLSNGWMDAEPSARTVTAERLTEVWTLKGERPEALDGVVFSVPGLERSITSVIVKTTASDGVVRNLVLTPRRTSAPLSLSRPQGAPALQYFSIGVEHILTGVDHLSFVLGLILLIGVSGRLLKAVTAFTLSHSISLALVALGFITPPPSLIEALVALSILFLAVEILRARRGGESLTTRRPWLIAFAFGLLHGCAFAGALAEVGLPRAGLVEALLLFNLGVEAGQVLFILAAVSVAAAATWAIARLERLASSQFRASALRSAAALVLVYGVGSAASLWLIERLFLLFSGT